MPVLMVKGEKYPGKSPGTHMLTTLELMIEFISQEEKLR